MTRFKKKNSCTITFGNKVNYRKEESLAFTIALLHVAHGLYQENKEIMGQQKKTFKTHLSSSWDTQFNSQTTKSLARDNDICNDTF